jgi:hypothetical protein
LNNKLTGECDTLKSTNLFIQKELTNWPAKIKALEKEKLAMENNFKLELETCRTQEMVLLVK